MASNQSSIEHKINALTNCSFCLSTVSKPKCLSCLHTFCLNCLEEYIKSDINATEISCPLCRECTALPDGGVEALRDNFYIDGIIGLKGSDVDISVLSDDVLKCEACAEFNEERNCARAVRYCTDCDQSICESCIESHDKIRALRSHKLIAIDDKDKYSMNLKRNQQQYCEKHAGEVLRMFCKECCIPICVVCLVLNHNGHKGEEIVKTSAGFRKSIGDVISSITKSITMGDCVKNFIGIQQSENRAHYLTNRTRISARCSDLRKMIDDFEESLLTRADGLNDSRVSELQFLEDETKVILEELKGSKDQLEKMRVDASDCELVCVASELISNANRRCSASEEEFTKVHSNVKGISTVFNCGRESIEESFVGEFEPGGKVFVTLGMSSDGRSLQSDVCYIHLDDPAIDTCMPYTSSFKINIFSAACVINNTLYVVGMGESGVEFWGWDFGINTWCSYCSLPSVRYKCSLSSIKETLFVLGGATLEEKRPVDEILKYDSHDDVWKEAGRLAFPVYFASSVSCGDCIYVFGGRDESNTNVRRIQIYNQSTSTTTVAVSMLPLTDHPFQAVLWGWKAVLVTKDTACAYDLVQDTVEERQRFRAGLVAFGLMINDDHLYMVGGGVSKQIIYKKFVWKCSNEIKRLPVRDFLSDEDSSDWTCCGKLPFPSLIRCYSPTSISI